MRWVAFLGLALLPVLAEADEVFLRGGGHLSGQVVERGPDSIVVDVGAGQIGFPLAAVERIVPGTTPLALYRERAARLAPTDAKGWLLLALWAQEQDLLAQARKAFEHVLALDPSSVAAHRALGHVQVGDRWMTEEESYRARGYVRYEGSWVTPEERRAIFAERAATAEEARASAEAEARLREAEARAGAAEAEARRAEAESRRVEATSWGTPYAWAGGGFTPWFGTGFPGSFHRCFRRGFPCGFRPSFTGLHPFCQHFVHPFTVPVVVPAAPIVRVVKTRSSAGAAAWR